MRRRGLRRWVRRGMLTLPWLGVACSQVGPGIPVSTPSPAPVTPGLMFAPSADESFRPPLAPDGSKFRLASAPVDPSAPRVMPISLDAVLGLAEDNNPQITLARTKVWAAFTEKQLAAAR